MAPDLQNFKLEDLLNMGIYSTRPDDRYPDTRLYLGSESDQVFVYTTYKNNKLEHVNFSFPAKKVQGAFDKGGMMTAFKNLDTMLGHDNSYACTIRFSNATDEEFSYKRFEATDDPVYKFDCQWTILKDKYVAITYRTALWTNGKAKVVEISLGTGNLDNDALNVANKVFQSLVGTDLSAITFMPYDQKSFYSVLKQNKVE
jgi:hypothetical protein